MERATFCASAALSITDPGGFPCGTLTSIVAGHDGSPIFFAAKLTLAAAGRGMC
ncbi:hypothetical protein [Paenirhodobacter sp.]|uniref:hypothetical protein n=1 Tax=Paenirhodobacter sp. TaxID=1965326 RepID=UPI003B3C47DD